MKVLSFDVGIKNLAYCLIDIQKDNMISIIKWNVIDLSVVNTPQYKCHYPNCISNPSFSYNDTYLCKKHAREKKAIYLKDIFPLKSISSRPICILREKCQQLNLLHEQSETKLKKKDYIQKLQKYINEKCLVPCSTKNANEISLIDIGKRIMEYFDTLLQNQNIDIVLIENQISPIANRMKCIQGMISQYFIMKHISKIEFVSSINKLKYFIQHKLTYKERKKESIQIMLSLFHKDNFFSNDHKKWEDYFLNNKKKDDLADSFLQIIPYLIEKYKFNLNIQ